jgi:hypothetical protein
MRRRSGGDVDVSDGYVVGVRFDPVYVRSGAADGARWAILDVSWIRNLDALYCRS